MLFSADASVPAIAWPISSRGSKSSANKGYRLCTGTEMRDKLHPLRSARETAPVPCHLPGQVPFCFLTQDNLLNIPITQKWELEDRGTRNVYQTGEWEMTTDGRRPGREPGLHEAERKHFDSEVKIATADSPDTLSFTRGLKEICRWLRETSARNW